MSPSENEGTSPSWDNIITEPITIIDADDISPEDSETNQRKQLAKYLFKYALIPSVATFSIISGFDTAATTFDNIQSATNVSDQNTEMSLLASNLLERPVRVDCNDDAIEESGSRVYDGVEYSVRGFVQPVPVFVLGRVSLPVMTLTEGVCDTVLQTNVPELTPETGVSYAFSVATVLHELEHINQVMEEDAATCYAYQKLPLALGKLGMEAETAVRTAQLTATMQSHGSPSKYLSDECKPGGALDLEISSVYVTPPSIVN